VASKVIAAPEPKTQLESSYNDSTSNYNTDEIEDEVG